MNFDAPTGSLSSQELLLVCSLSVAIIACLYQGYRSRDPISIWRPMSFFAALYLYYFVIGPLIAVLTDSTFINPIDYRPYYYLGWVAGLVGFLSTWLGYSLPPVGRMQHAFIPSDKQFSHNFPFIAAAFSVIAFAGLLFVIARIGLNPLSARETDEIDLVSMQVLPWWGYIYNGVNLAFVLMVTIIALARIRKAVWLDVVWAVIGIFVLIVYAKIGFRGRIVVMALACFTAYYLVRGKRPSIVAGGLFVLSVMLIASVIVLTRDYFVGMNLGNLAGRSFVDLLFVSFQDSVIFGTTSLLIDSVPRVTPYVGVEPLTSALVLPIPRGLWPNKPTPEYLTTINTLTGTGGQAVPNIGEYYMAFGWWGVVGGSMIIGWCYRNIWSWFLANRDSSLAAAVYSLGAAMIFPLISRGYLGQFGLELVFGFLPLVVAVWFCRRSGGRRQAYRQARTVFNAERPSVR